MTIERETEAGAVFGGLERAEFERLTRELTGYCYRMLGSPFDAEDAVQDTMVRAWREIERFEGRSSLRTWLYRIATNVCIDMLRKRKRRMVPMDLQPPARAEGVEIPAPLAESTWVLPIPDARIFDSSADPAGQVVARETVRLAFIAALQRLTPRQRATLILRDVLQFSAIETAELLDTTVASANSALQRARATAPSISEADQRDAGGDAALVEEYVAAFEAYDVPRLTALLRSDAVNSMPPLPLWLRGPDDIRTWMLGPASECKGSRVIRTSANGCAAFAQYRSDHQGGYYPWAIQVLETDGRKMTGIHAYVFPELFTYFGFPAADPGTIPPRR
ncbi:MAG TPA: sigma-70 family RNA polymerase sigma factor [Streptosporangiaceae bacterium]|nr:sigma-70 family RNA polymerase sigma factor [Streptosporangiaceae bacterium]